MKVLAVCGFGVGSSMILKMSLDKAFKKLNQNVEVENTDITAARGESCDAIFTSEELYQELKYSAAAPVYTVKKYMDLEEVEEAAKSFLKDVGNV